MASAQESAKDRNDIVEAIAQLRKLPQWQHLKDSDAHLDEMIVRAGPELNASIKVHSESGEPIAGAIVVAAESVGDLFNHVYRMNLQYTNTDKFNYPLAIRTTNKDGQARISRVRRSGPGQPNRQFTEQHERNIARVSVVVIHPNFGLATGNLQPTDELQELSIKMNEVGVYRGRLANSTEHTLKSRTLLLSSHSDSPLLNNNQQAVVLRNSPFAPRATIADDGSFEWHGLPSSGWLSPALADNQLTINLQSTGGVELKQQLLEFEASVNQSFKPEILVRCLDEENRQPIAGCRIGQFTTWDSSDEEGKAIARNYGTLSIPNADQPGAPQSAIIVYVHPPAGYVTSAFAVETPKEGQTVELKVPRGVKVTGQVVEDGTGKGIGGVDVRFTSAEDISPWKLGTKHFVAATTDAKGKFVAYAPRKILTAELCSLAYGFETPIRKSTKQDPESEKPLSGKFQQEIDLSKSFDQELEFRLKRSTPVRGVVIDRNGKPATKTQVTFEQSVGTGGFRSSTITDDKGAFQFSVVPCGSMKSRVFVKQEESTVAKTIQYSDLGSYEGGPVVLDLGQATETRSIVGRVVVDGKGQANATVIVYREDPDERPKLGGAFTSRVSVLAQGTTDEQGNYEIEITNAEATHCHVNVAAPEHLHSWTYQTISIGEGKTRYPTFEFRTRYGNLKVSGEVLTPDGDVVAGASIKAFPSDRVQLTRLYRDKPNPDADTSGLADAEGKFECKNLSEGKVELQIYSREGYDYWTSSMFQSIVTTAPKSNLILIVDPKLSVPPDTIEPVSTKPLESLVPVDRFKSNGRQYKIEGTVTDSNGSPVAGATAFVMAARPFDGPLEINPIIHPLCQLQGQTDDGGRYSITVPDDRMQVCVGVLKVGYLPTLTKYLTKDNKPLAHKLSGLPPKDTTDTRPNFWNSKMPNAMLVASVIQSEINRIDNFATDGVDRTDLADENGRFIAPRSYSVDGNFIAFKPGQIPKLLSHPFATMRESENSVCSFKGRIVNDNGPVANYRLCCSGSFREHLYETVTNELGEFQFDGLFFQNSQPSFNYYVYGDPTSQDSRGWLKTRIIASQADQTISDLGDLKLDSARRIRISAKSINGQPFTGKGSVNISLRQRGSKSLVVPLSGSKDLEIENLPCEPVKVRFELGRNKLFRVDPEFQKLSFADSGFSSVGIPMDEDLEILITIQ